MIEIINALKDANVPAILTIAGVILILLALGVEGIIKILPDRQKVAGIAGTVFLGLGVILFLIPSTIQSPDPLPSPSVVSEINSPQPVASTPSVQIPTPSVTVPATSEPTTNAATPTTIGAAPLVNNGDFEQNRLEPSWTIKASVTLTDTRRSGQGALVSYENGDSELYQGVNSTPGTIYQVSAWCKAEPDSYCSVVLVDEGVTRNYNYSPRLNGNGDWQKHQACLQVINGNLFLYLDGENDNIPEPDIGSKSVIYDDVSIEEVSSCR